MKMMQMPRKPVLLAVSLVLAGIAALSIHVGLLALGAPFPLARPPLWAQWLSEALIAGAVLGFLKLAGDRVDRHGLLVRVLVTLVVVMAIQETLRVAIMNIVVTGGWAFSMLGLLKPVIRVSILVWLCVGVARIGSGAALAAAALAIGAVSTAGRKLGAYLLDPLLQQFAWLAQPDLYVFPYPFHVTLAAYATFAEPVIGTVLLAALVQERLARTGVGGLLLLGTLVASIKGVVGHMLLYSAFTGPSVLIGGASWSQFVLEFIALGALVGLAWKTFGRRRVDGVPGRAVDGT